MSSKSVTDLLSEVIVFWQPPKRLSLSEWSDEHAYLSPESAAEPGKWRTIAYQKGIMDALTDISVETVTVMKSARIGYTKMLNWDTAYHIHHDPCPQLIVQPTIEDAQGYSKDEIAPMVRDMSVLSDLVADVKSRDSNNTILKKAYPGGILHLVGANSARGFRRITVKRVKFDEVDGYPLSAGQEGDQIKLGTMRSDTYWDRKIILGSTPTVKGFSRIEKSFDQSDQRYYFVPCPFCNHFQTLIFENIKWPKDDPDKAYYECESCHDEIPHSKKRWMVENGEWRATKSFNGHAGFHIWAGYSYSPNATWAKIAKEFLEANEDLKKNKDVEKLKTFTNTILGKTWEERGERPDASVLLARCESYTIGRVPERAFVLTSGVDTQDNRLAVVVKAWGRGEESWLIHYEEIYGDPDEPYVWEQLDLLLNRPWPHATGIDLHIVSMAIDTGGHRGEAVKNYCRTRSPKVMAIKGHSAKGKPIVGKPSYVDVNYAGSIYKEGVQLWMIGTDTAKGIIFKRLQKSESGPGTLHFPLGIEEEYFKQLTNEKLVTLYKKGFPVREWVSLGAHEALDCEVYAYAAAYRAGLPRMNFDDIENSFEVRVKREDKELPKMKPQKQNKQKVVRSNFLS